ncbi:peroxisomal biogenesis factor [Anaeramoeba flamelloides]|uniref:Peroxisomal biogenesis factor n=1 Tax=Anaeramoeba flamelloides TaxID=1746091 RepID=A0AAV7ZK06_9EUKA|nr:peroxisomal biogenesis factor [Anaeramoeba flamelloides]
MSVDNSIFIIEGSDEDSSSRCLSDEDPYDVSISEESENEIQKKDEKKKDSTSKQIKEKNEIKNLDEEIPNEPINQLINDLKNDPDNPMSEEDITKMLSQFEEMSGDPNFQELMKSLLQSFLSKENLEEPFVEVVKRYPEWLKENKNKVDKKEYERYQNHFECSKQILEQIQKDVAFEDMTELFQELNKYGDPPNDLLPEDEKNDSNEDDSFKELEQEFEKLTTDLITKLEKEKSGEEPKIEIKKQDRPWWSCCTIL